MLLDNGSHEHNHVPISGLQKPLQSDCFIQACQSHNELPTDDVLPQVEDELLEKHRLPLEQLFKRYSAQDLFAVYILHRHFKVPVGSNLVGRTEVFDHRRYYWTRIVANDNISSGEACGRKFVYDEQQGWLPCEFHEGLAPDLSKVDTGFFPEFANYLTKHKLTSTFGLEYIVPELLLVNMFEITLSNGVLVLVESAHVSMGDSVKVTTSLGWPSCRSVERRTDCWKNPDGSHKEVNVDTHKSYNSFNDVIGLVENQLSDYLPGSQSFLENRDKAAPVDLE
ncbi:hypothetical protein FLAG1_11683 [Fusarium langsethiae]|uniref:Uncharacterized protein n=1 Tax=Fusarium langsethiae TaxID=179993 RepID=A0A0M9ELP0_FUSLA|nr:hypothetical protein FLAG1_11683 [Fusarium langsethiae]